MRTRGVLIFAFTLIILASFIGFALAADDNSTNTTTTTTTTSTSTNDLDDASLSYKCLENQIGNKTDIGFNDALFAILSLGGKSNLLKVLDDNKASNSCWPKSSCTIKDTAIALIAYDRVGRSTDKIKTWLLGKTANAAELGWYLEIDLTNHESGSCTVSYDSTKGTAAINEDMSVSISGGATSCLSSAGYILKIKDSCLDKTFSIQCSSDFVTTLVYQKGSSGNGCMAGSTDTRTCFISSEVHSAASLGTTEEKVSAKCFKTGSSCDYEGSLWAALALQKAGEDISRYIPYLISLADDNSKYLPSVFLYLMKGGSEQYSDLISLQKQGKYWEQISGNRWYDTSLAMLGLQGSGAAEMDNTKNYLLSIRNKNGCWGTSIRDTSFLLYSGWPKSVVLTDDVAEKPDCTSSGKYCTGSLECTQALGTVMYGYSCSGLSVCCSLNPLTQTCSSLSGVVCNSGEECSGDVAPSIDGSCCIGNCREVEDYTCEQYSNRFCKSYCSIDETEMNRETCQTGVCCEVSETPTPSHSWIWILLLGILIIIVIIAIMFRDKIRLAWYKFRGKAKVSPVTRPSGPGVPMGMRPMQRPMMRPMQRTMPIQRRPNVMPSKPISKDSEMEETLRKLREMSK